MRERGMIFNAEMVRAILNGSKTQTRRIMKIQPEPSKTREGDHWFSCNKLRTMVHVSDFTPGNSKTPDYHEFLSKSCPFGEIGDRIWVRETYRVMGCATDVARLMYKASERNSFTESTRTVPVGTCTKQPSQNWTPSIHMPRWASRILLEITNVRVGRLQDISDEDCIAEGIIPVSRERDLDHQFWRDYRLSGDGTFCVNTPRESFESLWKSVRGNSFDSEEDTGPGSWYSNPWVWVIEFKRVEASNG